MAKASNELSNSLVCWGLKRVENHEQPILDSDSLALLNKYNGISMGNKDKNYIYLTFDLGYEAGYTSKILDVLKENNVTAVFFITGHYLNTQEDLVKRMIEEGHIVGNHTVNHKSLSDLSDEEIKNEVMNLHNALYEKFGYEMTYFRPPKGEFSERVLDIVTNLGYKTVLWSFAYDDWDENKQGREAYGKSKILDNLHNRRCTFTSCYK
jgi:peptidoglycan-N-acetylmuramic acid deacetylase